MTLIAREFSYDVFLLNNRAGGLMTVMVFGVYPMSTYGTSVRISTWQVFEQLIAAPCGNGSLILGIDRDTKSATLLLDGPRQRNRHRDQEPRQGPGHLQRPAVLPLHPAERHPTRPVAPTRQASAAE